MGVSAFLEPLVVVSLLVTGTVINRDKFFWLSTRPSTIHEQRFNKKSDDTRKIPGDLESGHSTPISPTDVTPHSGFLRIHSPTQTIHERLDSSEKWRQRTLRLWGWSKVIKSPNTRVFQDRFLSRMLRRYPFLIEAWYWALIYWVSVFVRRSQIRAGILWYKLANQQC